MRVCLASTSPARLMLLHQAGIEPITIAPGVDEDAAVAALAADLGRTPSPIEQVQYLARAKAAAVAELVGGQHPRFDGIVIGGDSMFELDGAVYGKPHTPEAALQRWQQMRGNTGILHSGHSVLRVRDRAVIGGAHAVASTAVAFVDDVTDGELDAYIASGEPLEVAGAFTLDGLGAAFISRVDGDPSAVVGMSIPLLRNLARELDVSWPSLWNRLPGAL